LNVLGFDTTQAIPQGIKQGANAPVFRGVDQNGNTVSLKERLTKGSVIMIFYKGEWCGICNRHLATYADSLDMIQQNGVSVIAITPEIATNAKKTAQKTGLNIPIISDSDLTIMNAYGVTFNVNQDYQDKVRNFAKNDLTLMHSMNEAFLPVPATYIINPAGIISYVHFDHNYRNRPPVKELLMSL
jgi:peroxiredoxin